MSLNTTSFFLLSWQQTTQFRQLRAAEAKSGTKPQVKTQYSLTNHLCVGAILSGTGEHVLHDNTTVNFRKYHLRLRDLHLTFKHRTEGRLSAALHYLQGPPAGPDPNRSTGKEGENRTAAGLLETKTAPEPRLPLCLYWLGGNLDTPSSLKQHHCRGWLTAAGHVTATHLS